MIMHNFIKRFFKKHKNPHFREKDLWNAVANKDLDLMCNILDSGISPNCKNKDGLPLIHAAAATLNRTLVSHLIKRGVNLEEQDSKGCYTFEYVLHANEIDTDCPSKAAWEMSEYLQKKIKQQHMIQGCENCKGYYFQHKKQQKMSNRLACNVKEQASLYQCPTCGIYWEESLQHVRPLQLDEAKIIFPEYFSYFKND